MRKITTHPKLAIRRDKIILQLFKEGFFIDEIGEMFRLQKARISQIINNKKAKSS